MQKPIYKLLTWILLLLGILVSGVAGYWVKFDIETHTYSVFVYQCEEIQHKLATHLKVHEQALLGGAALFEASKSVERDEWRTYVEHLRLNEHFNGIQGLGFSLWIPGDQLSEHQANIRAEGFPDYTIRPEGEREFYSSVIFLEPFTERNLRSFGYDMYSEPVRRAAMERARDESIAVLSARVKLVQETDKNVQAGTLMYVPVYKKGYPTDTLNQRRAALLGWVYSPFRMADLLNSILLSSHNSDLKQVHLQIYDGQNTQAEHLLYDNNLTGHSDSEHGDYRIQLATHFNGTVWTLQFEQMASVSGLDYSKAWITVSTGVLISLLVFLLSNSYLNTRQKAANIAVKLAKKLRASEMRFRTLTDSAPVLIWMVDTNMQCYYVNKVWMDFTGRSFKQELGIGWSEGLHPDDKQSCVEFFAHSFNTRLPFTTEYRLRRHDGEYRWLLDNGVPNFSDDGSFLGYIGSCIDITERKLAQEKIENSLSLLHATLEASSDAVLVVDTQNNWVLHNQKFDDLWQTPEEIIASKDDTAALSYALSQLQDPDGFFKKVQELYDKPEASSFDLLNFKNGKIVERYSIPQRINNTVVGRVWSFRDVTERKRAEYFLQIESEKNRTLLRNASDGIHILDTEGNIIEASDSFCNMLGYQREEIIGMNVSEWDVAFTREECLEGISKQFATPVRSLLETRHRCKDGTIIDVEISRCTLELNGKPVLFNSSRDISQRKCMERKLRESENKLNTILDNVEAHIYIKDQEFRYQYVNKRVEQVFNLPVAEIIGKKDEDFFDDKTVVLLRSADRRIIEFGERIAHEGIYTGKNTGVSSAFWTIKQPLYNDDGQFYGICGISTDITERKRLEEELQRREGYQRALLDNFPFLVWLKDEQSRFLAVNQPFANAAGFTTTDELLGKTDLDFWPQELAEAYRADDKTVQESGQPKNVEELVEVQGERTWFETYKSPLIVDGKIIGTVGYARNITERKLSEIAVAESQNLLRTIIDTAPIRVFWKDCNLNYLGCNIAFAKDAGMTSPNDLIGKDDYQMGWKDQAELYRVDDRAVIESGIPKISYDEPQTSPNGDPIWLRTSKVLLKNTDNETIGLLGIYEDITERKCVELALKESQSLLQTAQRAARLGHYIADLRNMPMSATWTNDLLFDEIFGIDNSFVRNMKNWMQLIHPDDRERVIDTFKQFIKTSPGIESIDSVIYRIIRPNDGSERWIEAWACNFYDEQDNPLRQVGMIQDITERKQTELAKRASEEQLRAFYEFDLVGLTITSPEKGWIRINNYLCNMLEYSEQDLRQMTWTQLTYPDDLAVDTEQFERLLANEINGYALEKRFVSRTGRIVFTRLVVRCARKSNGEVDYVMAMVEDISEYKQAEAQLRIAATVFESQEGMLVTDANQTILNANHAFLEITGYSAEDIIGQTPRLFKSGRHDQAFYTELWDVVNLKGAWQGEIWNRCKNGDVYPQWLTITVVKDNEGIVTHYVATITDISERKATEEYINRLAFYDSLTQLPNRRLLQQRIRHGIERHHRSGNDMAILMMDLDKFKAVNDTLGHAAGDELLQQVAKRIKTRLREVDMVARLGGDEFVILIDDVTQQAHLGLIAESVIHSLTEVFTLSDDNDVYIGASIGIAIYPQHGDSEDAIMDNADIALYHAKAKGRGCFVYFSDALTQKIKERAIMETRLRHAIDHQEFFAFFQPQFDIKSNQLVGAEALVLWYHPTDGYFMPQAFLDVAEETGLIVGIGEWLLRETCRLGKLWLDAGLPLVTLAVNVSPYQFHHCDIGVLVTQILEETGLPAQYLALEITESGLMENNDRNTPILNVLREKGVHLIIDNFGKGYSSLSYLKHFPLDMLKIDKTFIDDLPFSQDDSAITSSIISMGHHLGFKVLAEGVETVAQLNFLREQGCDEYQGVHNKALPVIEFEKLLRKLNSSNEK